MLLGHAGIVSVVSSLILTFINQTDSTALMMRLAILVVGLLLLWALAMSKRVDRHLSQLIDWTLEHYTDLDVQDYASLLRLSGGYRIVEILIEEDDWLANRTLIQTRLRSEGIMILGINR